MSGLTARADPCHLRLRGVPAQQPGCWVPRARPAPSPLSLGRLMPGDGSLVADAEQGRARPRGSSVSPESPPPCTPITCAAASASRCPQSSCPTTDPHSCCPHIPGPHRPRQPARSRGVARGLAADTSADTGAWHLVIPAGRSRPAAFLRVGPDPGSRHAWQLHLLPHWPRKTGKRGCGEDSRLLLPRRAPEAAERRRAGCRAATPDAGSAPGL